SLDKISKGIIMKVAALLLLAALATPLSVTSQGARGQAPAVIPQVTTTKLGGNVYGIDGQGGRAAALVGPEGIFLVDAQFPVVTEKIVAALKEISPAPLRLLVNAHTDGDTAVKFEQADVLMTGDVFRSQGFPAAAVTNGGSVLGTIDALTQLVALAGPNTKVVPGHGPVVDKAALVFHRDMAVTVRDRVAKALQEG